jgi:hypothetical protein
METAFFEWTELWGPQGLVNLQSSHNACMVVSECILDIFRSRLEFPSCLGPHFSVHLSSTTQGGQLFAEQTYFLRRLKLEVNSYDEHSTSILERCLRYDY